MRYVPLVLLLFGCQARDLGWHYELDPSIRGDARGIVAYVRPEACDSSSTPLAVMRARRSAPPSWVAPTLPAGTVALDVVALDAACRPIGRGCEVVALPDEPRGAVLVRVAPSALGDVICEAGSDCDDGLCVPRDGG